MNDMTISPFFSPRKLVRAYLLALGTLALLAIAGHFLIQWAILEQSQDADQIKTAEQQKMLTLNLTQTALIIQLSDHFEQRWEYIDQFQKVLALWEQSYVDLKSEHFNGDNKNKLLINELFQKIEPHFEILLTQAQQFLTRVQSPHFIPSNKLSSDVKQLMVEQTLFLRKMEAIITQYHNEASNHLFLVQRLAIILLIFILLALLLEWFYLFQPSYWQIKQTLQQLVASKERVEDREQFVRTILNNTLSVIYVKDLEGRYLLINRQYEQLFQVKEAEILDKSDYDIFEPLIAEVFQNNDQAVLMAKRLIEFEETAPQTDGLHTYLSIKFPLLDKDNQIFAICGISTDITLRKQVEKVLIEREGVLRALFNAIPEAALLIDRQGQVFSANETTAQRLQTTLSQLVGASIYHFLSPRLIKRAKKMIHQVFQTNEPVRFEAIYENQHFDNFIYPVTITGKKTRQVAVISFNVTQHKQAQAEIQALNERLEQRVKERTHQLKVSNQELQAEIQSHQKTEEALRMSEERYRRIVDTTQEGIWILDATANTQFVNQKIAEMLGYTMAEIQARSLFEFLDENTQQEAKHYFAQDQQLIAKQHDFRFRRQDGTELWTIVSTNPLVDDQGQLKGILAMIVDITERKQAEIAQQESLNLLQKILSSLNEAVLIVNLQTSQIEACNETTEIMFDYHQAELIGQKTLLLHINEEKYRQFKMRVASAIKDKGFFIGDFQMKRKNGNIFHTEHFVRSISQEATRVVSVVRDITERKQAEAVLQERENQFRSLTEMMAAATFILQKNQIIYANPAATTITGYSQEQLLKIPFWQLFPTEIQQTVQDHCLNGFNNHQNQNHHEWPLFHQSSKQEQWLDLTGRLIDYQGELAVLITAFDITAQKREEKQFRQLLESAPDAMVIVNQEGLMTFVNTLTEELFGYQRAELLGQNIELLMPERYRSQHYFYRERYFHKPHKRAMGFGTELYGLHRNSIEFPVEVSLSLLETPEGTLVSSAIRDISERKQAEETLQKIVQGVSATTGSNFLQYLVEYLAQTLQVRYAFLSQPRSDNIKLFKAEFFYDQQHQLKPFQYDLTNTPCEQVILKQKLCIYLKQVQQTFPKDVWLVEVNAESYVGAPLFDTNGQFLGLMAIVDTEPLTEQNKIESVLQIFAARAAAELERMHVLEKLQEERVSLAKRIQERTAELTAANAELARAARMKDEFLANMSHELRTPLNAILGMSEVLQEGVYGNINEQQRKSLSTVEESGRHLLALINDILDLAKIEAGKVKLDIIPVSVQGVINVCQRMIKEIALKKQIQTQMKLDREVNIIQADERYLKQILINLLTNAIKFTPKKGRINLEVCGKREQGLIEFTISDTGIGIAATDMDRLFQPFVQLNGGLNRSHEGTGLGLSLVYRLTELHGGSVSVESELGIGSCFTVSLPWHPVTLENQQSFVPQIKESKSLMKQEGSQANILLADDNPTIIETISDYLKAKNYQIITAHNGVQAIEQTRENNPDIILMDIQMPGMDGIEAIRRIRADEDIAQVPIIALTALAMPGDRERCLKAGANYYLSKPVSYNLLVIEIENLLQNNQAVS